MVRCFAASDQDRKGMYVPYGTRAHHTWTSVSQWITYFSILDLAMTGQQFLGSGTELIAPYALSPWYAEKIRTPVLAPSRSTRQAVA